MGLPLGALHELGEVHQNQAQIAVDASSGVSQLRPTGSVLTSMSVDCFWM